MSINTYKQYQRTQRVIRTEDNYSGGMMYINTPLDTGYSRIILNLDLAENGAGLKPRPGLKTFLQTKGAVLSTDSYAIFSSDWSNNLYCKANSVIRRNAESELEYVDTVIVEKDVYKVGPYKNEDSTAPVTRLTHDAVDDDPAIYFEKNRGHCFAWQGDLYHMHEDGLFHFNEKLTSAGVQYDHAEVEPRALTPKEAVTTGYNMLHDDPYRFSNTESVATSGDILGILPYFRDKNTDAEGSLALKAGAGTPIYLRVYLAVANDPDIKYQYKIEWRESTQGNWEEITGAIPTWDGRWDEDSVDGVPGSDLFTHGIRVPWSTPQTLTGVPIYVRVTLKVASENIPLYKISKTSNIGEGTILGAGTSVPNLSQYGLNLKHVTGAFNEFNYTGSFELSSSAVVPEDTYISYFYGKGQRSVTSDKLYAFNDARYYPESGTWESANTSFTDSTGVQYGAEYFANCFYKTLDATEPSLPTDDAPVAFFKLPAGITCTGFKKALIGNNTVSDFTLIGPCVIPVTCVADTNISSEGARKVFTMASKFDPGYEYSKITNLYAVKDCDANTTIKYNIGAGTILRDGDILNDVEVYQSHAFTAAPEGSGDYYTATALSKIAPVTSVVSFLWRDNASVASVINYDLTTAKGMCYWKDRLVLWGIAAPTTDQTQYQEDSANLLFFSELNDPSYFPYPQNVNTFTEPILHAVPFGDDLLVITATSMHLVVLNADGLTWTTTQIQSNLRFREDEMYLVQVVNNMVLFKSGPQFYLLVPSTVNVGNLVVAPITKNIKSIFDNPEKFIRRLFGQFLQQSSEKALLDLLTSSALKWRVNTFVDFEHVHITYTASCRFEGIPVFPTVDFLYNTTSRSWRIYLYSALPGQVLIRKDAVKAGVFVGVDYLATELQSICFKYRRYDPATLEDSLTLTPDAAPLFSTTHYLDTGYRNQDPDHHKRYREAQLRVTNHTTEALALITEYALDGVTYIPLYAPEATIVMDSEGTPSVNLTYGDTPSVTGSAVLSGDVSMVLSDDGEGIPLIQGYNHDNTTDNVFAFMLAQGAESRLDLPFTVKLRTTILGKGYAPSLKIYSKNKTDFTILGHTWVYRIMNAR